MQLDQYTERYVRENGVTVIHLGMWLDARCLRCGRRGGLYDLDLPPLSTAAGNNYTESEHYHMIACSATDGAG
jgi:O-methyltransferase involved in polyketide biosynthesis